MDAPKLKVMVEEEKAIWHGDEIGGNQAPTIMTASRFRELLANTALEGNDLEPANVERVAMLLEKLHHRDANGEMAPVFSKRLLKQLLQVSAPKEETSDVLRLLSGQCRAAQSYQPPEVADVREGQSETEQQDMHEETEDQTRSPFLKLDGTLNDAGEVLHQRLMPQLKGLPVDWTKIRLVFSLLREHRTYAAAGEVEALDRLEQDIIMTIGEGRTYKALEELREACTKIHQERLAQAPQDHWDNDMEEAPITA